MDPVSATGLTVLSIVVFFYILFLVIRAAVSSGILDADSKRAEAAAEPKLGDREETQPQNGS